MRSTTSTNHTNDLCMPTAHAQSTTTRAFRTWAPGIRALYLTVCCLDSIDLDVKAEDLPLQRIAVAIAVDRRRAEHSHETNELTRQPKQPTKPNAQMGSQAQLTNCGVGKLRTMLKAAGEATPTRTQSNALRGARQSRQRRTMGDRQAGGSSRHGKQTRPLAGTSLLVSVRKV